MWVYSVFRMLRRWKQKKITEIKKTKRLKEKQYSTFDIKCTRLVFIWQTSIVANQNAVSVLTSPDMFIAVTWLVFILWSGSGAVAISFRTFISIVWSDSAEEKKKKLDTNAQPNGSCIQSTPRQVMSEVNLSKVKVFNRFLISPRHKRRMWCYYIGSSYR